MALCIGIPYLSELRSPKPRECLGEAGSRLGSLVEPSQPWLKVFKSKPFGAEFVSFMSMALSWLFLGDQTDQGSRRVGDGIGG